MRVQIDPSASRTGSRTLPVCGDSKETQKCTVNGDNIHLTHGEPMIFELEFSCPSDRAQYLHRLYSCPTCHKMTFRTTLHRPQWRIAIFQIYCQSRLDVLEQQTLTLCAMVLFRCCHASVEHKRHSVLPVPVGLSSRAFVCSRYGGKRRMRGHKSDNYGEFQCALEYPNIWDVGPLSHILKTSVLSARFIYFAREKMLTRPNFEICSELGCMFYSQHLQWGSMTSPKLSLFPRDISLLFTIWCPVINLLWSLPIPSYDHLHCTQQAQVLVHSGTGMDASCSLNNSPPHRVPPELHPCTPAGIHTAQMEIPRESHGYRLWA